MPLKPGASVGRGEIPAVAMRPKGVSIGPSHGIDRQGCSHNTVKPKAKPEAQNRVMLAMGLGYGGSLTTLPLAEATLVYSQEGRRADEEGVVGVHSLSAPPVR